MERVRGIYPAIEYFHFRLAQQYEKMGQHDAALGVWKRLVSEHPRHRWQERLADCCERVGNKEFAQEIWTELADRHPTVESLRNKLLYYVDRSLAEDTEDIIEPEISGNELEESGNMSEEGEDPHVFGIVFDDPLSLTTASQEVSRMSTIKRIGAQIKRRLSKMKIRQGRSINYFISI